MKGFRVADCQANESDARLKSAVLGMFLTLCGAVPALAQVQAQGSMSPWADSPVGTCLSRFTKTMRAQTKENSDLQVHKETSWSSTEKFYVWVWDGAPSRNPSRVLYEVVRDRGCVVLYMPFSDGHDFRIGHGGQMPLFVRSVTSPMALPTGGWTSSTMIYRFDERTGAYGKYPYACERQLGEQATKANCEEVVD